MWGEAHHRPEKVDTIDENQGQVAPDPRKGC